MENQEVYVNVYTVYWMEDYMDLLMLRMKHKFFSLKHDAQRFAKKHKKDNKFFKPIIIRTIRSRSYFRPDVSVEVITNRKEIKNRLSYFGEKEYKKIGY